MLLERLQRIVSGLAGGCIKRAPDSCGGIGLSRIERGKNLALLRRALPLFAAVYDPLFGVERWFRRTLDSKVPV